MFFASAVQEPAQMQNTVDAWCPILPKFRECVRCYRLSERHGT
jgi:hypothetical protein